MANPETPNLAPTGQAPSVHGAPDDNFSQRIGIGLAVSLVVNLALFAGASLLAKEPPADLKNSKMSFVPVPSPTPKPSESPSPTPAPSAAPSPTPAPKATPSPEAKPTPEPSAKPTPEAKPSAEPTAKPTPVATPKPTVATPKPATPKPVPSVASVIPTPVVQPSAKPSVAVQKAAPTVITKSPQSIKVDTTLATPPPNVVKQLPAYRAANPTKVALGSRSADTLTPRAMKNTTSTSALASAAPAGAASGSRPSAAAGEMRRAAGNAGAIGAAPAAMAAAPIVVAPIVESSLGSSTRQLTTVQGTAGRLAGRVAVVALSAKASSVSTSSFEVPTAGGNLRAGTVTARQGSGAGAGATAMSGTPTVITTGAEYSVSAPGAPNHGNIGVRGNKSSVIGTAVSALQQRGNSADVAAGVGVYGDAPGGTQRGAVGRAAAAAVGQSGELSAVGGGLGPVGDGTGSGNGSGRGAQGVAGGKGTGLRGTGNGNGGGAGNSVAGGSGQVYGDPNGVPGGAIRANVAVNTTRVGEARANTTQVATNTDRIKPKDTEIKAPITKDPDFDEVDELTTNTVVTQISAKTTSKPGWEPPNVRFSGVVEVKVTIEANGSHSEEITKSTGVPELDRYLKTFFAGWRWEPGKVDNKPIKSSKTVRFRIN